MTVTEVRGHGKQKGHTAIYRGKEYNVSLLPKMEIEVVVADEVADEAVKAIIAAARTGEIGDGRVFVMPVAQSYGFAPANRHSGVVRLRGWRRFSETDFADAPFRACPDEARPQRAGEVWR